jgi:hypothetical protein
MIDKELEKVELREKALSARDKAARACHMAARIGYPRIARLLQLHAAAFEAKAEVLERDIEAIEESLPYPPTSGFWANVRRWRAKAEEIRTVADSMSSDAARHALARLAGNYETMAERAEGAAKNQEQEARSGRGW